MDVRIMSKLIGEPSAVNWWKIPFTLTDRCPAETRKMLP
jgi:hypothetical protein